MALGKNYETHLWACIPVNVLPLFSHSPLTLHVSELRVLRQAEQALKETKAQSVVL